MKIGEHVTYTPNPACRGRVSNIELRPNPEGSRDLYLYTINWHAYAPPHARRDGVSREWERNVRKVKAIDLYA